MNAPAKVTAAPVAQTFDQAFVKLQSELGPARKLATNPAFKSKYADLGAVWDAIMEPLHSNGFGLMQIHQFDGDTDYLETILIHAPSGGREKGRYRLRPTRQDPQGVGSATTYARRYAACAMLGVVADEDDDGNAASAKPANGNGHAPAPQPPKPQYDQDPDGQVTAWVNQQKAFLANCETVADVTAWEELRADGLDRLRRKSTAFWSDLIRAKETRIGEINLKGKK